MLKKIWDISPMIKPGIPVWPGDTEYAEARSWQLDENCPVNVSRFTMSTHTGAHADAPFHYSETGIKAAEMDLTRYLGPCQVIDVRHAKDLIRLDDFAGQLQARIQRVLFRTNDRVDQENWDSQFTAVAPETIEFLAANDVFLIGVDTPSLDPQESKTLDAHHCVRQAGMSILEGLILDDLTAGIYELIALPLKLANLDAAPVRAILREI